MNEEFLELLNSVSEGALATIDAESRPFASAVGFIVQHESTSSKPQIFILMSDLARHAKHIALHPEASLLVMEQNLKIPVHEKKRATLYGEVKRIEHPKKGQVQDCESGPGPSFETLKKEYLKAFPKSEIFFSLPDFRFYELKIAEIYWIGGFGKAQTLKLVD